MKQIIQIFLESEHPTLVSFYKVQYLDKTFRMLTYFKKTHLEAECLFYFDNSL